MAQCNWQRRRKKIKILFRFISRAVSFFIGSNFQPSNLRRLTFYTTFWKLDRFEKLFANRKRRKKLFDRKNFANS
ncbi:hypothetical protein LEP1GSC038_2337 [Leptospira weilii str. 2006001855]|uniref:Uncharacterized protein n=1 Tax=Leptospira weilii str. 2006001855 TaxID=996804 RepID=M6FM23_9LEPT|nr:hypothetical protein LEP1GSC051_3001 [Leptospira sp. P2653]EMM71159.1 hypothetical protein LEP1GSC038_2337 [Leptospira weilii str. 2006001855]EMN42429.1 hypothetical protein LEP1GSC086_1413 [Leptospira weilii str. LNT 1234]OMI18188.1 hypothetical protein BUQ74_06445 [Leptospira weilii serovar Heyan]